MGVIVMGGYLVMGWSVGYWGWCDKGGGIVVLGVGGRWSSLCWVGVMVGVEDVQIVE